MPSSSSHLPPPPSRHSRALGALLALHAGDSLGATLEFCSHGEIKQRYPSGLRSIIGGGSFRWSPGSATDDTDMTRCILLAYRDLYAHSRKGLKVSDITATTPNTTSDSSKDAAITDDQKKEAVAEDLTRRASDYFLQWLDATPSWPGRSPGSSPKDIGNMTWNALEAYRETREIDSSTSEALAKSIRPDRRDGNGSLMRCIPTALLCADDPEQLVRESILLSRVTHASSPCMVSCAAYNTMVASLITSSLSSTGTSSDSPRSSVIADDDSAAATTATDANTAQAPHLTPQQRKVTEAAVQAGLAVAHKLEEAENDPLKPVTNAIQAGIALSSVSQLAEIGPGKHGGFPGLCRGHVLETLTLAVAAVLDPRPLEDVLVDVTSIGGDTDTNAAVAGGLLGARDGADAVPRHWRDVLQFGKEFEELLEEMIL